MKRTLGKPRCWWCNGDLVGGVYAKVTDPIGNVVKVHKVCEADTTAEFKQLTAQVGDADNAPNGIKDYFD